MPSSITTWVLPLLEASAWQEHLYWNSGCYIIRPAFFVAEEFGRIYPCIFLHVLFRLEVSCSKSSFFKHILQAYKLERSILSSNLGIWIRNIDRNSKPALLHTHCVAGHRGGSLCIVRLGWICNSYTRAISDKGNTKGAQTQVLVHQYVPKINSTYGAL